MIDTKPTGTIISAKKPINYVFSDTDAEQVYCVIGEDESGNGTIDFTGLNSDGNLTAESVDTIKTGDIVHITSGANEALCRVISAIDNSGTVELVMFQYINEIGASGTALNFDNYAGITTKILNKNIDTYDFRTDISSVVSTIGNIEHTELLSDGFDDVQDLRYYKVFFVAYDDVLAPYLLESDNSRAILNVNSSDVTAGESITNYYLSDSEKKPLVQLTNQNINPNDRMFIYFMGAALKAKVTINKQDGTTSYSYPERLSANKDIGVLVLSNTTIGNDVKDITVQFINPADDEPISTAVSFKIIYPTKRFTARYRNDLAGWDSITFMQVEKFYDGVERDIECKEAYLSNEQLQAINGLSRGAKVYGGTRDEFIELWSKKASKLEYSHEALAAIKFLFKEV